MARKKKKKKRNQFLRIVLVLATIAYGLYLGDIDGTFGFDQTQDVFEDVSSNLKVSYLDVGQADSILIENNEEAMLIDAGNNEDGALLVKYFEQEGINNFKYVVGTHPHEDHIGGLDDIIDNFSIECLYIPDAITTTKTFMDVLDSLEAKNMTYKVPKIGDEFYLGDAKIEVIYTGTDTSDLNNTSIVLKLNFGKTSFLFTGDATSKTEEILLDNGADIKADVLKIGHHGSKYSTTDKFLSKVNPKYAIISVGANNSYKHPDDEVINKLNTNNIDIYRTDQKGTIIITSDGNNLNITNIATNVNGGQS